jgi:glycine C-acetyltransferase/8-amino-7-oxononanoate synthase
MVIDDFAGRELEARRTAGLDRRIRWIDGVQDTWVTVDGRRALLLCSNNYLGLANHPAVREAATKAAADYGVGAGASRLISGSMRLHRELEEQLAAFKGTDAALLFNSGYHANVGTISTLVGSGDAVFSDELNHASIIDGCRLSGACIRIYRHNDVEHLDTLLAGTVARRRLVVTESVFSMDGDSAPLTAICDLAERYDAMVMVDEAHATGVVGPEGRGMVAAEGLQRRVAVQMGTLGKALGTFGAFVAGSRAMTDWLLNTARSFVYTTALPPPVVAAAAAALQIVRTDAERRQRLHDNAQYLRSAFEQLRLGVGAPGSHILPVLIGDAERAVRISERLLSEGVFVQGIRPPTVPPGTARLRVTPMSTHKAEDLAFAVEVFRRVFAEEL